MKPLTLTISPEVARFNNAVELADILLGPEWGWATVDALIVELARRGLALSANELWQAAMAVGEIATWDNAEPGDTIGKPKVHKTLSPQ